MKSKAKFLFMAIAAAAGLGMASMAQATPTVQITMVYRGTVTGNSAPNIDYTGYSTNSFSNTDFNANLSGNSATQNTANLKAIFDVYLLYNGGTVPVDENGLSTTTAFQGVFFDVVLTGAITNVSASNVRNSPSPTTTNKYYAAANTDTGTNQGQLDTDLDANTAGDMQAITIKDGVNNGIAFYYNFGTAQESTPALFTPGLGNKVGHFGIAFTNGALASDATISLVQGTGGSFSWYTDPNSPASFQTASTGMSANSITIAAAAGTPEPASMGVLALGGMALLARRRRNKA